MIQLYVKCRDWEGKVVYEGVKKEYVNKKDAYDDFIKGVKNFRKHDIEYHCKTRYSHIPKHYNEDIDRMDLCVQLRTCGMRGYVVTLSLRGLNKK